jgi:hypothetical protein
LFLKIAFFLENVDLEYVLIFLIMDIVLTKKINDEKMSNFKMLLICLILNLKKYFWFSGIAYKLNCIQTTRIENLPHANFP